MAGIDAGEWLELWCAENMNSTAAVDQKSEMRELAEDCAEEARQAGISIADLKAAADGDLERYLMKRQNAEGGQTH